MPSQNPDILRDKFVATILGTAIGDAMGAPFETMVFSDIDRIFIADSFGDIKFNKWLEELSLPPGSWTDDTQLTLATMEAIIEGRGKFDMELISEHHITAYNDVRRGWGKSTKNSCERLSIGTSWRDSGEPGGSGNGVVMKISPIGLRQSVLGERLGQFFSNCYDFGRMTHLETSAVLAGTIHAYAIFLLAMENPKDFDKHWFIRNLQERALVEEKTAGDFYQVKISDILLRVGKMIRASRIKHPVSPADISREFGGAGSFAPNSLGASYTAFLINPHSFVAVNEIIKVGGDTDSNAGIVAGMLGALNGTRIFPPNLVSSLEESLAIQTKAGQFFDVLCE